MLTRNWVSLVELNNIFDKFDWPSPKYLKLASIQTRLSDFNLVPLFQTWLNSLKEKLKDDVRQYILMLFEKFVGATLKGVMKMPAIIPQVGPTSFV